MKLGKAPARPDAYRLRLADYLNPAALPPIPENFGHYQAVQNYGMLANDSVGDCVIAGAFHESMIWNAENGVTVQVSDAATLATYSAITGYDPSQTDAEGENPTDRGTDVQVAAQYRVDTGIADAAGTIHKIACFVSVNPQNLDELLAATYLFGAVGVGYQLPNTAIDQFQHGLEWSPMTGAQIRGGHYVPLVGFENGYGVGVTWGRTQLISQSFITTYADEAVAYLSLEMLSGTGVSPEGFNVEQLRADLNAVEAA